jgi:PAS domain S-box-containing protein
MSSTSSRIPLLLALLFSIFVVAIGVWTDNALFVAPFWLIQLLLLGMALWGQAHELRNLRQVQAQLQAREQQYRLLSEGATEAVWAVNLDGAVTYLSPSVEHLRGYNREESLAMTWEQRMAAGMNPAFVDQLRAVLARLRSGEDIGEQVIVATHTHREGRPVWIETTLAPLCDDGGAPLGLRLVSRDVTATILEMTERRRIEQELRILNQELEERVALRTADLQAALAELQSASALKSEFLALVSHELRTPLTGVLAMAELLDSEAGGPLSSRQRTYLAGVQSGSHRLLDLVNNILSYTQLLSGSVELQHEPCRLDYLLDLAAAALRPAAARKRQTLTITVTPASLTVVGDPIVLVQIVKRLLDNAVKFTPEYGAVGTEARLHPSSPSSAAACLEIVVWDSGVGLTPADLPHIVKPFVQGESGLARSYEGIGMGLTYVDRMLAYLGGRLTLEPNPGGGSRFIVTLPVALP